MNQRIKTEEAFDQYPDPYFIRFIRKRLNEQINLNPLKDASALHHSFDLIETITYKP
jgi:hypothetical protein